MPTIVAEETTLILDDGNGSRIISDFLDGDTLELTPVNPVSEHTNGSGNSVGINKRSDGGVHELKMRVFKFSDDDVYLSNKLEQAAVAVFNGSMKENYSKDGVGAVENWLLESGSITTRPTPIKNNLAGNTLMEYTIKFRNATRSI